MVLFFFFPLNIVAVYVDYVGYMITHAMKSGYAWRYFQSGTIEDAFLVSGCALWKKYGFIAIISARKRTGFNIITKHQRNGNVKNIREVCRKMMF
jgi:hypothetical protein